MLTALCELASSDKYGYAVCARSIPDTSYGEWLYDLCWLETTPANDASWLTKSMPLAVECEWLPGLEIDADFDKLVQSRATLRLMIFSYNRAEEFDEIVARLARRVQAFLASDETDNYLLAAVNNQTLKIEFLSMTGHGVAFKIE